MFNVVRFRLVSKNKYIHIHIHTDTRHQEHPIFATKAANIINEKENQPLALILQQRTIDVQFKADLPENVYFCYVYGEKRRAQQRYV